MPRHHAVDSARTAASPVVVYGLLSRAATWPTWIDLDSMSIEREGDGGGETIGAVRLVRFHRLGIPLVTHEQVVELIPDRRFSYSLVSGLPLRDYRADVDLTPTPDGGTLIRWSGSWCVDIPGIGHLTRLVMRRIYRQFLKGLTQKAELSA